MKRARFGVFFLAAIAVSPYAKCARASSPHVSLSLSKPLQDDPLGVTIERLPNGLTIYLSPNSQVPRIVSEIVVRAGSKYDPPQTTGLAHYLEHMMFKGTTRLGTLDYAKEKPYLDRIAQLYEKRFASKDPAERKRLYEEIDAQNIKASAYEIPNEIDKIYKALGFSGLNASTSKERTVYVCDFPKNQTRSWAMVESERFRRPVFRLFQSELEAVYEEKNRSMDNADEALDEALDAELYPGHPYGIPVLGTVESLKNPSLRRIHEFFKRYYVPRDMAVVLSGDFDPDAMRSLLRKEFGSWRARPLHRRAVAPPPPLQGVQRADIFFESPREVAVAWRTVAYLDSDADALTVMDMIMDNAAAGLMNLDLGQAQKVEAAGSYPEFYNDGGDWVVWAVPKEGQSLKEAESLLMAEVAKLKAGEFTDDDVQAVITRFEVERKLALESNWSRADFIADSFAHFEPWPRAASWLERLRRIKKSDVLRVANRYLGENRAVVYRHFGKSHSPRIEKPNFTPIQIDGSRHSAFADQVMALPTSPIEPRWLTAGADYEIQDAPFGRLYKAPNPFDDVFDLDFVFNRGFRGTKDLCAALSLSDLSGAGTLSPDQFKKRIFALGSTLSVSCGERESSVSLRGLDKNLWPSLSLLERRFDAPNISSATLRNFIQVSLGAHQDAKKDPDAVFGALAQKVERGKNSAVLRQLSDQELRSLTLKKAKRLITGLFRYRRRVGYVGNRPAGEVIKLLETRCRLKKTSPVEPLVYIRPRKTSVFFVQRDMVQARVGIFSPDEIFNPAHAVDYQFLASYLGGGMSSLIFQEIREARSYAYAAWGGYQPGAFKGDPNRIYGGLSCQADKTSEAASLLLKLLQWPGLSQARFDETMDALKQSYLTQPVRFRSIPRTLMDWEDQGLPLEDPRGARFKRLLDYKPEDLAAFETRLKSRPMAVYILGDAQKINLDTLKPLGALKKETLRDIFPY